MADSLELVVDGRAPSRSCSTNRPRTNNIADVVFDDGTVWDASELVLRLKGGYSSQVTQMGTAGNDTITGTAGDDVIDGGAGDDFLSGVSGFGSVSFYAGAGHDTVREGGIFVGSKRGWGEVDGIKLVGLAPADVTFSRLGDDLFVRLNATGDTLTVQGHSRAKLSEWNASCFPTARCGP